MSGLDVRKDPCELDFLALGALVHRLDPGVIPFCARPGRRDPRLRAARYATSSANLADCFGLKTGVATAMVNYGIGELVQARVREMGVKPFYKWFDHDGVRGPNIATVYSDGRPGRAAPGRLLQPIERSQRGPARAGRLRLEGHLRRGVKWFHPGTCRAFETTSQVIIEGMKAAKAAGAVTSFDLNYRAKLWASVGGAKKGVETIRKIVEHVDALVGNEEDLQKGLGLEGQDVQSQSKLDPQGFFQMIEMSASSTPTSSSWPPPSARSTRPTATTGPPSSTSTARTTSAPRPSST